MSARVPAAPPAAPKPPITRIEAHYRKFLAGRWGGLVLRSAILTSASLFLVPGVLLTWRYSFLTAAGTLFIAGPLTHLFAVHVVLRARRSLIIAPAKFNTSAKPTAYTTFTSTFTSRVILYLLAHALFAFVTTVMYAASVGSRDPSVSLGWLAPTLRHPWHGNERLWFLISAHTLFSLILGGRDILADPTVSEWPRRRMRFAEAVKQGLLNGVFGQAGLLSDASLAGAWAVGYSLVYFTFRHAAWRFLVAHFSLLRPFVINFTKSSRDNLTWSLTYHLFVLQLTALIALRPATSVVGVYLTQPLRFDSFTRKSPLSPDRYLVTALTTSNPYYLSLTIMEIQRVSHIPSRRKAIFADLSKSPTLLHEIWHELLVQLGHSFQTLKTRGGTFKTASAPVTVKPGSAVGPADPRAIAIKRADIFRPVTKQKSTLQLIAQSVLDPTKPATPSPAGARLNGAGAEAGASTSAAKKIEGAVLKRIEQPVKQAEHWAEGTPVLGPVIGGFRSSAGWTRSWAGETWARRSVEASVPDLDRIERIVDTLVTLAVASTEEDTYGLVQSVLPATLEVFVRFRAAVIALEAELVARGGGSVDGPVRKRIERIVNVFDDGVRRIGEAFGSSLSAFRFPPTIAHTLTDICRDPVSTTAA